MIADADEDFVDATTISSSLSSEVSSIENALPLPLLLLGALGLVGLLEEFILNPCDLLTPLDLCELSESSAVVFVGLLSPSEKSESGVGRRLRFRA